MRASFLELYNEEVRDLLSKLPAAALALREDGSGRSVHSVSAYVVRSSAEMHRLLEVALHFTGRMLMAPHTSQ